MQLAFNMEGTDVAERFNAMGVSAFVLKYRVPLRAARPGVAGQDTFGWAPLMDAQRAMGIVRSRAAEWNIDATKVGFAGFSAGGHLTVHITTAWGLRTYPRIDGADDLPCRPDFAMPIYPWKLLLNDDPASMQLAPEVSNISALTPPVMIVQNEARFLYCYFHARLGGGGEDMLFRREAESESERGRERARGRGRQRERLPACAYLHRVASIRLASIRPVSFLRSNRTTRPRMLRTR